MGRPATIILRCRSAAISCRRCRCALRQTICGLPWREVGLVLGQATARRDPGPDRSGHAAPCQLPRAAGHVPTYSLTDLLADRSKRSVRGAHRRARRLVSRHLRYLCRAVRQHADAGQRAHGAHHRDSLIQHDFIRGEPAALAAGHIGSVALLAIAGGFGTAVVPTRLVALPAAAPVLAWVAGAQRLSSRVMAVVRHPALSLIAATLTVLLFRYGFVDVQRRRVQAAFQHYLAPDLVDQLAAASRSGCSLAARPAY